MSDNMKRQPKGIPVGGQFAANDHDEAGSPLSGAAVDQTPSAIVGDAKVVFAGDGDQWRAHLMVDKDKLPFGHPLRPSADDDGFIAIGSVTTRDTDDLEATARLYATKLNSDLDEVGSSQAESVAQRHLRDMEDTRAYRDEVILNEVNETAVADKALAWLQQEHGMGYTRDTDTREALLSAARNAIENERSEMGHDPDDIARSWHARLGERRNDPLRHRALSMAARDATNRAKARRENVVSESIEHRMTGSGYADDPAVRAIAYAAASDAYTATWRDQVKGSYEDMAEAAIKGSAYDLEFDSWSGDKQEVTRLIATRTAMDGHTAASTERFA